MSGVQRYPMSAIGRLGAPLMLAAALTVAPVASAASQDVVTAESIDTRWLPWIGCWRLAFESAHAPKESDQDTLLCLAPSEDGRSVELTTLAEGESFFRQALHADGESHPFEEWGCRGKRSAEWSQDGLRLFTSSESRCEGAQRSATGVSAIVPGRGWLDIQAVGSGELRHLWVRQYRPASVDDAREAGYPSWPETYRASASARRVASDRLSIDDVVEAFEKTDPAVVEALLVERGAGFDLDGAALKDLAATEAPPELIDLMVALSYPSRFTVERVKRERAASAAAAAAARARTRSGSAALYQGGGGWGRSGYWYPFYFAPYSYWPYYGVALAPASVGERSGTRAVVGRGYTRVAPVPRSRGRSRSGGPAGLPDGSGSGGSSVSSGGYRGGGSTGRTAKPRDNP